MYWHGILDYDNRDNRKLAEVKDFYKKLKCLDEVCGADYTAAFGVLKDYDNMWDTNVDAVSYTHLNYRNTERGKNEKNSKGIYYTNGN